MDFCHDFPILHFFQSLAQLCATYILKANIILIFLGPMIDRIVVQCLTRTESLRWVEILRQQIKCARTSTALLNNSIASLQQAQLPTPPPGLPPHVSLSISNFQFIQFHGKN